MNPNKLTPGHNLMWESSRMMLPEHKERIREHQKELLIRTKPIIDEQQIALFSKTISDAMQQKATVKIQVFHPYQDSYLIGKIEKVIMEQNQLKLATETDIEWVWFEEIVDVSVI